MTLPDSSRHTREEAEQRDDRHEGQGRHRREGRVLRAAAVGDRHELHPGPVDGDREAAVQECVGERHELVAAGSLRTGEPINDPGEQREANPHEVLGLRLAVRLGGGHAREFR